MESKPTTKPQLKEQDLELLFNSSYKSTHDFNYLNTKYRSLFSELNQTLNTNSSELLANFNYEKLDGDIRRIEYHAIKNHLAQNRGLVEKDLQDVTQEFRPATYASRIGIILRKIPAITSKIKAAAYASEVGESFRPVVPSKFVTSLYVVSIGYVALDIIGRTFSVKDQGTQKMQFFALDTFIWHSLASLVLPAFVIHAIVKYAGKGCKRIAPNSVKFRAWVPAVLALGSIPFIIHPIDHVTDFVLDNSIRKFYLDKIAIEAHKLH